MTTIRYLIRTEKLGLAALHHGRPPAIAFWYRSSPLPLTPREISISLRNPDDPPQDFPGMLYVTLEPQGRLTGSAVPPQFDESKGPWAAPEWTALFAAAGLDLANSTGRSAMVPSVTADARAAWTGSYPETPEIPIRVEAAAFTESP